jgi:hypothetical protein
MIKGIHKTRSPTNKKKHIKYTGWREFEEEKERDEEI